MGRALHATPSRVVAEHLVGDSGEGGTLSESDQFQAAAREPEV